MLIVRPGPTRKNPDPGAVTTDMPRHLLLKRLDSVCHAESEARRRRFGLIAMGIALVAGLIIWAVLRNQDTPQPGTGLSWMLLSVWGIWAARRVAGRLPFDLRRLARRIEARFPDLQGRLLTALDLENRRAGEPAGYLEERLFQETLSHSTEHDWSEATRTRAEWRWPVAQGLAWLLLAMLGVHLQSIDSPNRIAAAGYGAATPTLPVEVTPGDTEVEKGSKLIVEARFPELVPETATVELLDAATGEPTGQSFPMRRSLDDPIFAAVVPSIDRPVRYRVVHGEGASEDFDVGVYELPRVERADVTVTPPKYAGQEPVTTRDVRKVTALQGSDVAFSLTVNHPVAMAELYGEDGKSIPLVASKENPQVLTATVRPDADRRYRVHLVDAADRVNAEPPWLTVKLRRNEPPKLELAFPGRDTEVSALEEVTLQGKVWDDLGLGKVGATVTVGERTETILLSEGGLKAKESHELSTLLALEDYDAQPNQLVSYHLWAEDIGPDGKTRRTESDLFFAEARDWEHEFREGVQQGEQSGEGKGNKSAELRHQQKEILNATWKVDREAGLRGIATQTADLKVVREGQQVVAKNVKAILEDVEDEQIRTALTAAGKKMDEAARFLASVPKTKEAGLSDAQAAERAAYQHLLAAEARETQVTQSKSSSSGKESASQQRQLMQLELKENENRYETERQAQKENTEQEEDLEVLSRLKELARRQEALAEKIQELEAALKAAKDEQERDELERRLERLREEQQEMLRDVDDLLERMESEKNAERMNQQSEQLRTAREQVREAGEKLERQELTSAANSARRAQEDLDKVQEELREKAGQQFAEELREMRQEARELSEAEGRIGEQLDKAPARAGAQERGKGEREKGEGIDRQKLSADLGAQKEKVESFLERMRKVSEQAEETEPALANTIYEAVRDARVESPVESLEQAARLTRYGAMAEAQEQERAAARAIDRLQKGVEEAAETVLGSEGEALRTAKKELDGLIESVQGELAKGKPKDGTDGTDGTKGTDDQASSKSHTDDIPPKDALLFFEEAPAPENPGPLTGGGYDEFAQGLRRVGEILDSPDLQADAAGILDHARGLRREFKERDAAAPQWDLVQMQLLQPMLQLRQDVAEELARVEKDNPLVPADRDPVPAPYRELVRRYYEKLAGGN